MSHSPSKQTGPSAGPSLHDYPFFDHVALGAGYAVLGSVAMVSATAQAQISYTDLDPDLLIEEAGLVSPAVLETLDVDGDGQPDFRFWKSNRSYGLGIRMNGVNDSWSVAGSRYATFFCSYAEGMVQNGPAKRPVDSVLDFRNVGRLWINTFPCGDITNWDPEETGYIGIRKKDTSGYRYGWIRATRFDPPYSVGFRLLDYALQETPNMAIAAGDPGDTCLPVEGLAVQELPAIPGMEHTVSLGWAKVPHAQAYRIEVSRAWSSLSFTRVSNNLRFEEVPAGTYSVRVKAECPSGPGAWSAADTLQLVASRHGAPEHVDEPTILYMAGGTQPVVHWENAPEQLRWSVLDLGGRIWLEGHGTTRGRVRIPSSWPGGWYAFRLWGTGAAEHERTPASTIRMWKP